MTRVPVLIPFSDAGELFNPRTIAISPYQLLSEAKPDDIAVYASIDFNVSISAVMENASDMDLFHAFITKQMKLRIGVQGALVYGVKLLGKEGALALAFPSLAKQILAR